MHRAHLSNPALDWLFMKGGMCVVLIVGMIAFALIGTLLGIR
jgi:hypothetical protein